jgi:hypothetical protein
VTSCCAAAAVLQTKATTANVNVARVIATVHITFSLLRGEQRRQNAWAREVLGNHPQKSP